MGWDDVLGTTGTTTTTSKTIQTIIINGQIYKVGMSSVRNPEGPGATRQLSLTPLNSTGTSTTGQARPFPGAGTYATTDKQWATVDAQGNILGSAGIDQNAWNSIINPPPEGGYQPQTINYGNGLVAIQTPDGQWTVRDVSSSGPAPVAYSSTRQAQQEAQAFQAQQNALDRAQHIADAKAQAAQAAADRAAQERMNRLRDLNDLIRQAMGNQQSAKEMLYGLRNDSFALAGAFGAGPQGVTPTQAFSNQLGNYANAPLPQPTANMQLPQIEQAIKQVPGAVPLGGGFGMAGGGTLPMASTNPAMGPSDVINMTRGQDGSYGMEPFSPQMGSTKVATLIGEGPNTRIEPGTEVAVTDKATGTTEIVPLQGGAATGATLPTASSSYGALSPMFGPLGFTSIPTFKSLGSGGYSINPAQTTQGTIGPSDIMSRLGYQSSLVKPTGGTAIYYRDPSTGTLRHIANRSVFNQSGFNWNDVRQLSPQDFAAYGTIGPELTSAPQQVNDRGAYGPASIPFLTPFGQVLPNPFNIGAELQDAALNDPIAWSNYTSAYANARGPAGEALGISPEQLLQMARAPFPTGVPRQVLGYR